jgi:hypothetical protein
MAVKESLSGHAQWADPICVGWYSLSDVSGLFVWRSASLLPCLAFTHSTKAGYGVIPNIIMGFTQLLVVYDVWVFNTVLKPHVFICGFLDGNMPLDGKMTSTLYGLCTLCQCSSCL